VLSFKVFQGRLPIFEPSAFGLLFVSPSIPHTSFLVLTTFPRYLGPCTYPLSFQKSRIWHLLPCVLSSVPAESPLHNTPTSSDPIHKLCLHWPIPQGNGEGFIPLREKVLRRQCHLCSWDTLTHFKVDDPHEGHTSPLPIGRGDFTSFMDHGWRGQGSG